jgi:hypothetical protein
MTLSTKILIFISAIAAVCLSVFIIYKQIEVSDRQKAIETEVVKQKELADSITRSLNEYATRKDIEQFAKESNISLKTIQSDMDKLHADIKSINVVTIVSKGVQGTGIGSTGTGPLNPNPPTLPVNCPNIDPYAYFKARQDLILTEPFGNKLVPIGQVGFSGWNKGPWTIDIRPRTYNVTSVVGVDENQRQYYYNKFTISVDGKNYDLKIDKAETKQEYPETKFSWFNPRLFMGIDGGLNLSKMSGELAPNLTIGVLSYGRYKSQPDFSFMQVGIGYGTYTNKVQLVINPAAYNVGKHIPLMNNLYVGPSLYFGTNGEVTFMGGVKVAL